MTAVASFHLTRYPAEAARMALSRMAFDRRLLAATPGLLFWQLLGTGRGKSMTLGADLRRWALFAVWRDAEDLDRFLAHHEIPRRWRRHGEESWSARLALIGGYGRWAGREPLQGMSRRAAGGAPVAVLTRATLRPRHAAAFYRAASRVDSDLRAHDGRLASVGIGEWPLVRQGTFSVWADAESMERFAYRLRSHTEVVRRTRRERWYREELFARFVPYDTTGTWDGTDPLAIGPSIVALAGVPLAGAWPGRGQRPAGGNAPEPAHHPRDHTAARQIAG